MDLKLILLILQIIAVVIGIIRAIAVAFSAIIRCIEAWYQLTQTPDLNTWGKIVQWWKNFWSTETYGYYKIK